MKIFDPRDYRHLLAAALLVIAFLIPIFIGSNLYYLTILILMLVFIIYASAWNFLTFSGQGSLGHAAFFGLGGYAASLVAIRFGLPPLVTLLFGGCFAAFIGILIGLTCVRLREWFLAMVTFGFAVIIQTLIVSQLAPITGGWDGFPVPKLVPTTIPGYLMIEYYLILFIAIGVILIFRYLLQSRIGLALAAIRENEVEARAAGINPVPFKLFAFGVSAFVTGIAGGLEIFHFGYITPEIFGIDLSFWPIIYSITGGLGTLAGPVIGTIVVTLLWDGLNAVGLTYARFIIIGVLLVLIIIFLPRGLVSLPEEIQKRIRQKKT
ncbi:MAG: leucine/isoleucine/valine transporter permease subunit [Methanoregulaceae archaeon PtaB.Bin009]|jgi:branched-chain amino acid transport system permease protein|nr:MAG: leucine/isoleucine/valine transporter permease subunit [Methanoregulaceae archaeon PtaB.Bin009]OPY42236.1 MAG: leucine/isoleucine/valine transporter permease subunit [Methanoregulaceae archaeon PtaU1.Bin066]HNQ29654.1 branched-chain amino acid ABC transporter permease [Methanolinea sp.]